MFSGENSKHANQPVYLANFAVLCLCLQLRWVNFKSHSGKASSKMPLLTSMALAPWTCPLGINNRWMLGCVHFRQVCCSTHLVNKVFSCANSWNLPPLDFASEVVINQRQRRARLFAGNDTKIKRIYSQTSFLRKCPRRAGWMTNYVSLSIQVQKTKHIWKNVKRSLEYTPRRLWFERKLLFPTECSGKPKHSVSFEFKARKVEKKH